MWHEDVFGKLPGAYAEGGEFVAQENVGWIGGRLSTG
jgi:hypothetical protein